MIASLMSILLSTTLAAADPADPSEQAAPSFEERYGEVATQSIFLRERRAPRPQQPAGPVEPPPPPPPPPPVEASFVVIGMVEEGEAHRAFVEDRRSNRVLMLAPGDAIAEGRVAAIDLDGLVYQRGEARTQVAIGQDLRGTDAAPAGGARTSPEDNPSTAGAGASSAPGTPAEAAPADESGMSVLERMRLRRSQEVQR